MTLATKTVDIPRSQNESSVAVLRPDMAVYNHSADVAREDDSDQESEHLDPLAIKKVVEFTLNDERLANGAKEYQELESVSAVDPEGKTADRSGTRTPSMI